MAYLDSTTASMSGTTSLAVAVPTGVQADDIVILAVSMDSTIVVFTFPTGFTVFATLSLGPDGGKAAVGWKRLTGADTGNYTVTSNGSTNDAIVQAVAFTGRDTGNPPVSSNANQTTGQSSPVSVNATTVTAINGDDLCWISLPDVSTSGIGNGHTPPSGYTEREDAENLWVNASIATKENVSAGATGTVTGTFALTSGTSGYAAFLVRIPMAPAGGATEDAAGTVAGVSTVSGTLSSTVPLAASSAGASTVAASARSTVLVSASSAGASTTGGTVRATVVLAASSADASVVIGAITVAAADTGVVAGVSTVSGSLSSIAPVAASTAGVSTAAATARATVTISATSASTSTLSGAAKATVPIAGTLQGSSTASSTLGSQGQEAASGMSAGSSTVAAALSSTVPLLGTISGSTTGGAALQSTVPAIGPIAGLSTVQGTLVTAQIESVAGIISEASTVIGDLSVQGARLITAYRYQRIKTTAEETTYRILVSRSRVS